MFSTAGRTVKSGLVSAAVVSSWTWAATLLQSSAVAYNYGVSGPFWYASGATVQIILFATLAIELKRRAPNAHTFLEVIRARYGPITHSVYIVFGLMTNILVTAMLLTGGSAVVTSLTGVPTAAACFLLPVGVVLYTMFGGIKATFLTDYAHTVVIIVILLMFAFKAYATSDVLGSPSKVWELLNEAAKRHPVAGNADGSYLTMRSKEGAIFFVINIVGNFGTVFCDNGYYNKAIAASPVHALPGYVAGGLSWFAIPWLAATTMGLSALALESNPIFPTYPDRMDPSDVSAGLVLPTAATALMGTGGAVASILLVFMAVTSAMSAELIAVSSIWTYDIYQTYINPKASGSLLIKMSHTAVVGYAILLASFSTGLHYIGISMGYLYLLMGVIISSAVLPASLTLMWRQQNWTAATFTPILGLICSLIAWLVTAKKEGGGLSVATTGANDPMLAGNVVALLSPLIFIPVLTYAFKPQNYDWQSMKDIKKADDHDLAFTAGLDIEEVPGGHDETAAEEEAEQAQLMRAAKIARWLTVFLTIALLVLWPMPMYGSSYVFSKKFFTGWVVGTYLPSRHYI
jgi:SSS family transporter